MSGMTMIGAVPLFCFAYAFAVTADVAALDPVRRLAGIAGTSSARELRAWLRSTPAAGRSAHHAHRTRTSAGNVLCDDESLSGTPLRSCARTSAALTPPGT